MYLTNDWYFYDSVLDKRTCNRLKALGKRFSSGATVDRSLAETDDIERINGRETDYGVDKESRLCDLGWAKDQWAIDAIWPYMARANEAAGWNFDVKFVEDIQISRYKVGGFFNWHRDGRADCLSTYNNPDNKFMDGHARKLSMTVLLNDNYEGGEFQFSTCSNGEHKIDTPDFNAAGSVIVFPSFLEHRVAPITKGTRYSLVAWFVGPPFK